VTAPMCAEHGCPPRECEGVELTRARRVPVCLCGHPKVAHQHWRATALDCGVCGCLHYEGARRAAHGYPWGIYAALAALVGFWVCVVAGVGWPLIRAITRR
jgi:hypothetical protein